MKRINLKTHIYPGAIIKCASTGKLLEVTSVNEKHFIALNHNGNLSNLAFTYPMTVYQRVSDNLQSF